MNNGMTGAGIESKKARQRILGKPKGRARIVAGHGTLVPIWEYRGFRFQGRRQPGWGGGRSWTIISRPVNAESGPIGTPSHKESLMTAIDRYLDQGK